MLYWESDAKDLIKCSCGNDVMSDGFTPADATTGKEISPDIGSGWDQITWRCERCDAFSMPHLFWDAIGD
jgi:hypothetical protein